MNKTEFISAIAEKAELSKKDAEKALKAFTDVVEEELKKGEKIQLVGFGTFEVSERAAREGRNPQTGETMKVHDKKNVLGTFFFSINSLVMCKVIKKEK